MSSSDPVADFLARESEQMVGLEDDLPVPANINNGALIDDISPESEGPDEVRSGSELDDDLMGGALAPEGAPAPLVIAEPEPMRMQPSPVNVPRIEPEKIRVWREEQKIRLEKKDETEAITKDEWKAKAAKELQDWYKNRAEQLDKTNKNNRAAEEEIIRERDTIVPGQEWDRISKLCEFNPKNSKNTKDVSRMRGLLLQLKAQGNITD